MAAAEPTTCCSTGTVEDVKDPVVLVTVASFLGEAPFDYVAALKKAYDKVKEIDEEYTKARNDGKKIMVAKISLKGMPAGSKPEVLKAVAELVALKLATQIKQDVERALGDEAEAGTSENPAEIETELHPNDDEAASGVVGVKQNSVEVAADPDAQSTLMTSNGDVKVYKAEDCEDQIDQTDVEVKESSLKEVEADSTDEAKLAEVKLDGKSDCKDTEAADTAEAQEIKTGVDEMEVDSSEKSALSALDCSISSMEDAICTGVNPDENPGAREQDSEEMETDSPVEGSSSETMDCIEPKEESQAPRGKGKSGRIWRVPKEKASTVRKSSHGKKDLRKAVLMREEARLTKEMSKSINDERVGELREKRERQAEAKKQKEENAKKSEVVQVIKNPNKLKRLKKSQLRTIEMRSIETRSSTKAKGK